MIGSISKVRPCGHNHYYKYAHVKSYPDLYYTLPNYYEDVDDSGTWGPYSLANITTGGQGLFCYYIDSKSRLPKKVIKKFHVDLSNCTNFSLMFSENSNLERATIITDWNNETFLSSSDNIKQTFYGCGSIKEIPEGIVNSNIKVFPQTFRGQGWGILEIIDSNNAKYPYFQCFQNATDLRENWYVIPSTRPDGQYSRWYFDEQYTFENLVHAHHMCNNQWPYLGTGIKKLGKNTNFKSLKTAEAMFNGHALYEFYSKEGLPNLENGYRMLGTNSYVRCLTSFCPGVENPLPKLSNGDLMFNNATLNKESVLRILNSIPDWTGDSATHKLTLGISMDHKYDPEVNYAIKAVDASFTPVVELDELPTTNKNWSITVQWSPMASEDEYMDNSFIEPLELDTIQLPEGYTRCLYLKSNNYGQINTGYIPTDNTGIYAMCMHWAGGNNTFGSGSTNHKNTLWIPNNRTRLTDLSKNCVIDSSMSAAYSYMDKTYNFSDTSGRRSEGWLNWLNSRTAEMRTVEKSFSATIPTPTGTRNYVALKIFSSPNNTATGGIIYRAKISEGSEIVRDFIPALDPDGVPCMYELYEGKAYHNTNTEKNFEYKIYEE